MYLLLLLFLYLEREESSDYIINCIYLFTVSIHALFSYSGIITFSIELRFWVSLLAVLL